MEKIIKLPRERSFQSSQIKTVFGIVISLSLSQDTNNVIMISICAYDSDNIIQYITSFSWILIGRSFNFSTADSSEQPAVAQQRHQADSRMYNTTSQPWDLQAALRRAKLGMKRISFVSLVFVSQSKSSKCANFFY